MRTHEQGRRISMVLVLSFGCLLLNPSRSMSESLGEYVGGSSLERTGLPPISEASQLESALVLRVWESYGFNSTLRVHELVVQDEKIRSWQYIVARPRHQLQRVDLLGTGVGAWKRINALGLQTLPNQADLPKDGVHIADGASYSVKLWSSGELRSIFYANPKHHPRKEDQILARVLGILDEARELHVDRVEAAMRRAEAKRSAIEWWVGTEFPELPTVRGTSYQDARILRKNGDMVVIQHATGSATERIKDLVLPEDFQQ